VYPVHAAFHVRSVASRSTLAPSTISHEYVVVESGRLQLGVGDAQLALESGDSAYFAADVDHSYANSSAEPCTYYVAALIMRTRR
jgi:mannose-6-phosphate isomerase-like protein (cupin superfamily)